MPITIQEIIASDTISQLVDKTNFNFDQLLLNGGGPAGPAGPKGPIGPAGGRGPKGTTWYEDTATIAPGTTPTASFPTATPRVSDYYLRFNGEVWEYTGLTWSVTTVNLKGPTGPAGASGGFGLFFGSPAIGENTALYNAPGGEGNGATSLNEGIPSIMIGGAVTTTNPLSTIGLTNAYVIPNDVAQGLISSYASLMIHQKDSTARSIVFHGGAATPADKYYQGDIFGLSSIYIGVDDRLVMEVPKIPTGVIQGVGDLVGYEVNVPKRSQQFTAGKAITFQTGTESDPYFATENSDFLIDVGDGSSAAGNKFVLTTSGTANSTKIEAGGGFATVLGGNSEVGIIQMKAGLINLTSSQGKNIQLNGGGDVKLTTLSASNPIGNIGLSSGIGGVSVNANSTGSITIAQTNTSNTNSGNVFITNNSTAPESINGGDIYVQGRCEIKIKSAATVENGAPSIVIDYNHLTAAYIPAILRHTRFVGTQTWQGVNAIVSGGEFKAENANIYQTNKLDGILNATGRIFRKTGSHLTTDVIAGSLYEKWLGGTAAQTNEPMHQITIGQGNEGSPNGYPITVPYEAYDNSLTLKVSNTTNLGQTPKDYVTISKNKVAIAVPFILKRNNDANSTDNSAPTDGQVKRFGWDPRQQDSTPSLTLNGGMPVQADLNVPFIEIGIGEGFGATPTGTLVGDRTGFLGSGQQYVANFPVGQYPGQRITVVIYNQAYNYRVSESGAVKTYKYNGTFTLQLPRMRMQRPVGDPYTSYYSNSEPGAMTAVSLQQDSGDDTEGAGNKVMLDLMWNGSTITAPRGFPTGGAGVNKTTAKIQYGWEVMQAIDKTNKQHVNQSNTSGATTSPTTGNPTIT